MEFSAAGTFFPFSTMPVADIADQNKVPVLRFTGTRPLAHGGVVRPSPVIV